MYTSLFITKRHIIPDSNHTLHRIKIYYTYKNVPSSSNGIGKAASPALINNLVAFGALLHLFVGVPLLVLVDDDIIEKNGDEENEST